LKTVSFLRIFEGHLPIIVTSDLEILEQVFIKQFSHFAARKYAPHQYSDNSSPDLLLSSKETWRRLRSIISPTFSQAKMRELFPLMQMCSDRFLNLIEANGEQEINIAEYFDRLTMDTIWNCGFGVDIDTQNNPNNPFLVKAVEHFKQRALFTLSFKLRCNFA
jgi:cytochrome P450